MTDTPRDPSAPEHRPQIMIAKSDATVTVGGVEVQVRKDSSTAAAADPIVRDHPDLWTEFVGHYDDESEGEVLDEDADQATDISTDDVVSLTTDPVAHSPEQPAARDVRAWAKDNDIDVPAKGPIPADVVERYRAEHG